MKNIYLFLIAIITLASCAQEEPIDYAIVSGYILNTEATEMSISSDDREFRAKFVIDSTGSFSDTIRAKSGVFSFYDGKNYKTFYAEAGNTISINYDANDFKGTLTFTGAGSEVSNYLLVKDANTAELMGDRVSFYQLNEADYKAKSAEIKSVSLELISPYVGISEEHKMKEEKDINYAYLYKLATYENAHSYYAKEPEFKVSEGFLNELNDFNYHIEEDYLNSNNYKYIVSIYYGNLSSELAKSDSTSRDMAFLKIAETIPSEIIKNDLLSDGATNLKYADDMEAYYNLYLVTSTDEENNKKIIEAYEKLKFVAAGQPSPKFVGYENNAGGTTSLDDLKGKYLYIDVWATWCGPCIAEIPSLKKVEEQYHGKNIQFLSLSIDTPKDYDKWKKMIVDKELGGIQLLADNAWESKFVQDYLINGIPHFILLDPEGQIVKYSAPRPSNDKLIELFEELGI